jgi:molecular chaperone DnaK (HSP70)
VLLLLPQWNAPEFAVAIGAAMLAAARQPQPGEAVDEDLAQRLLRDVVPYSLHSHNSATQETMELVARGSAIPLEATMRVLLQDEK